MVFAELVTGIQISIENIFQEIYNPWFKQHKLSVGDIAEECFKICNEVDSESKMLRMLEKHAKVGQSKNMWGPGRSKKKGGDPQ